MNADVRIIPAHGRRRKEYPVPADAIGQPLCCKKVTSDTQDPGVGQNVLTRQMMLNALIQD